MQATAFESYADFMRDDGQAHLLEELRTPVPSGMTLGCYVLPPGRHPDPPVTELVVHLLLSGQGEAETDLGFGRRRSWVGAGHLAVVPVGASPQFDLDFSARCMAVAMPAQMVEALSVERGGGGAADLGCVHQAPFADPAIAGLLRSAWCESEEVGPRSRLFLDGAALTLLALLHGRGGRHTEPKLAGLPPRRLRRAQEFMEAGMARDLSLSEIAAEVGLSQQHFARAFKAATGMPPHRYLLQRRLARAHDMLVSTPLDLAAIALACGFSSQAHMTTAFRQAYATTPGRLREAAQGTPLAA